jgi:hypothetical protein
MDKLVHITPEDAQFLDLVLKIYANHTQNEAARIEALSIQRSLKKQVERIKGGN